MQLWLLPVYIVLIYAMSFTVAAIRCNMKNWPYYRKVYKTLPGKTFSIHEDKMVYAEDGEFAWFLQTNDFTLAEGVHLHNDPLVLADPYAAYWIYKYQKWCAKNISL